MGNNYTNEDLLIMQKWSLQRKIQVTQTRILEWYTKNNNLVYVSFSGGKDSTVLADLAARICKIQKTKLVLWFSDTGLEYPELREHTKRFPKYLENKYGIDVELVIDYPKDRYGKRITFKEVILKYGYPLVSKEQSQYISECRHTKSDKLKDIRINGNKYGMGKISKKWLFLLDAPFEVTHKCCTVMKKNTAKQFEKRTNYKPIVGTMTEESRNRKSAWLRHGCNAFDAKRPISQPMSFWTEQDVLCYITNNDLPYPSVYGEIKQHENGEYYTTGENRTGCMFCGFGCHMENEPNKFQRLKKSHPKIWNYCMKPVDEGGLGMKEVLEYIGVKIE